MSKPISLALVAALISIAGANAAFAGTCPTEHKRAGALTSGETMPKAVTDTVISEIDLGAGYQIPGRAFRLRRLEIKKGGVVPWHSHEARPAHIYVLAGEILEYRSDCAVPVRHVTGDVVAEQGAVLHWWKNQGRKTVILLSADILPPASPGDRNM